MSSKRSDLLTYFVAAAIPVVVGSLGAIPTARAVPTWYRTLKKPAWTPPARVFGPVWTLLYVMMGLAMGLVWKLGPRDREVRQATGLFAGQLSLNLLWSLIFFGRRAPGPALVEIVALWGMIVATLARFYRLRPVAGLLLAPYLLWTTYALTLNAGVWWMNRPPR